MNLEELNKVCLSLVDMARISVHDGVKINYEKGIDFRLEDPETYRKFIASVAEASLKILLDDLEVPVLNLQDRDCHYSCSIENNMMTIRKYINPTNV